MRRVMLEGGPLDGTWVEVSEAFTGHLPGPNGQYDAGHYNVKSSTSKLAYWKPRAPEASAIVTPEPPRTAHVAIEELTLHQLWDEICRRYPNAVLLVQRERSKEQEEERIWWQGACATASGLAMALQAEVHAYRMKRAAGRDGD